MCDLYMLRKYASLPIDLIIFYIFKDTKLFIFMYRSQGAKAIVSNQKVFLELQKEADKVRRITTCWIHFETKCHYIGRFIFRKNVPNKTGPSCDKHQICLYGWHLSRSQHNFCFLKWNYRIFYTCLDLVFSPL